MTLRRLLLTTLGMLGFAALLRVLAPSPAALIRALSGPQRLADVAGPGALVLAVVGGLAWLAWAWGALGLLLTAASALPGAAGSVARVLVRAVLPDSARRAAAVALGVGLALNGPLLAGTAVAAPAAAPTAPVPDWPSTPPGAAAPATPAGPDRPAAPAAGDHVVVPGECLWRIAAAELRTTTGAAPPDARIAAAVPAWWAANRSVIGSDPDVVLPGQVLTPPATS